MAPSEFPPPLIPRCANPDRAIFHLPAHRKKFADQRPRRPDREISFRASVWRYRAAPFRSSELSGISYLRAKTRQGIQRLSQRRPRHFPGKPPSSGPSVGASLTSHRRSGDLSRSNCEAGAFAIQRRVDDEQFSQPPGGIACGTSDAKSRDSTGKWCGLEQYQKVFQTSSLSSA